MKEITKRAFGTYKYVGMIKGGSPVYRYEFNDATAHSKYYIARQYLGAENDKIWKLKVMTMGFITFGRIAYTYYTLRSTCDSNILD